MKTYAESQGKKPFNWNAFLKKKTYTPAELRKASRLAQSWVTCACGNMCAIIPRDSFCDGPEDSQLSKLGTRFYGQIEDMKDYYDEKRNDRSYFPTEFLKAKKEAIKTLAEIEDP